MTSHPDRSTSSSPSDRQVVEEQLGRPPEGFQEVVCRRQDGTPAVIRVASVVDGVPFPTLYWLTDPELCRLVYDCESMGGTQQIQDLIDQDVELQNRIIADNRKHIEHRASFFDADIKDQLQRLGIEESFAQKGIGGNSNFLRVRCLHAYLAAHLVQENVVGELVFSTYGPNDPLVNAFNQL